jgi:hypothetical protein
MLQSIHTVYTNGIYASCKWPAEESVECYAKPVQGSAGFFYALKPA